jgi:beta-phosphoglucomutase-like phosphatase (HAD superfamily)
LSGSDGDRPLRAVLWDMDGTLVDTEPYWIASEFDIVAEHGNGSWSHEHGLALVGKDLRDSAAYVKAVGEMPLEIDEIVHLMMDGVITRCAEVTPWRPGARELLADINALGVPCALVTMSWSRLTDAIIPLLPEGSFVTVVTGDDVANGKPHPEPYLTAAARLGVDPHDCIAIEDSTNGARSADAAGCCTLVVPHVVPVSDEHGHHRRTSLAGVSAADLSGLLSSCRRAATGA